MNFNFSAIYQPMQARFPGFPDRHGHSEAARAIVAAEEQEILLYECHKAYASYGDYMARKAGG